MKARKNRKAKSIETDLRTEARREAPGIAALERRKTVRWWEESHESRDAEYAVSE